MPESKLLEWFKLHSINVLDTNKRASKITKMNAKFFNHEDYNVVDTEYLNMDTETLYTIEIAESELEKICDFENQVFNNLKKEGHFNFFNVILEQKEKEKYLKDRYPAVKKAYEHYSLMLKLAESGEL